MIFELENLWRKFLSFQNRVYSFISLLLLLLLLLLYKFWVLHAPNSSTFVLDSSFDNYLPLHFVVVLVVSLQ
jgi:hypothetical protein